ncbi:hypothetical protein GCM10010286_25580 [Streptomyces toxytricini]|nr:hypothetical protein GCM10010286_25580 [Streptomyces toxytricini]
MGLEVGVPDGVTGALAVPLVLGTVPDAAGSHAASDRTMAMAANAPAQRAFIRLPPGGWVTGNSWVRAGALSESSYGLVAGSGRERANSCAAGCPDWQSESPELWAFLESLHCGDILSGTVAAIERFGVFAALDDGPAHPLLPGVGFIVVPEPSWRHIDAATDVVQAGQRVSCEFLRFDTYNAEDRLSLKALEPDPLQDFADRTAVGQELRGTVEKVLPFGVFVDLGDGIVGLAPFREAHGRPAVSPVEDFEVGEIAVVVTEIELLTRRVFLSRPEGGRHEGVVPAM